MLGLEGGAAQWVFDRGQLCAQDGLLGVVISAHRRHEAADQEKLGAQVRTELQTAFPSLPAALWTKVIEERRATFACTVGVNTPPTAHVRSQSLSAGDTQTAPIPQRWKPRFRSGVACARMVLGSINP